VYGVYHPDYDHHVYRNVSISDSTAEPFNRGHDDDNKQYGPLTVDGLTITRSNGTLIQVSQYAPSGPTETHFRGLKFVDNKPYQASYINTTGNGQPKNPPPDDQISYFIHDHFGPGRCAKVLTESMLSKSSDGLDYKPGATPVFGKNMRVAEAKDVVFPELLTPVDDLPPMTIVTSVNGRLVRGSTIDDGAVKRVLVNGREAKSTSPNFLTWEIELDAPGPVKAHSEDAAGNVEKLPHERT
jgi:hypothetical protein